MASKRLAKELEQLQKSPISYCSIELPDDSSLHKWRAKLSGPAGTPYEHGTFLVEFHFPPQYPFKAPDIKFITRIYHPNVRTETGEICNDLINDGWSPTLNVKHCVQVLYNMISNPDVDHPLEVQIATQMMERPKEFAKTAVKWTKEYAAAINA